MLFFKSIPEGESSEDYKEYKIDNKVFFFLSKNSTNTTPVKRRYSDQFKDPLFIARDTNRKLNMLMKFKEKYSNIDLITNKCVNCIEECISILKKEYSINPTAIFETFDLEKFGINPEDYGVDKESINKDTLFED